MARRRETVQLAISALLCVVAVSLLLFKIEVFPQIGSDEWWLLGRHHAFLRDLTFSDPVAMDVKMRTFNALTLLPVNYFLRFAISTVSGLGVEYGRLVSAVQFIIVGTAAAVTAWRLGATPSVALLGLPVFLLTPSVFFVARTYRYEQDLFFLGSLALVLSLRLLKPSRFWLPLAIVGGTFAGMVSVMHLFGIGFPLTIVVVAGAAWLLNGRPRPQWRVIGVWLACAAVPVTFTVAYFALNMAPQQTVDTLTRSREAQQLVERMAFLRGLFPAPLPGLPNRVVETWNALRWGLMPQPTLVAPLVTQAALNVLGTLAAVAVFVGMTLAVVRGVRRARRDNPLTSRQVALLAAWLLAVAQLALTAVRPHTDYTVYVHGAVMLSVFALVAIGGWSSDSDRGWHDVARWSVLVTVVMIEVGYLGPLLAGRQEPAGVALRAQVQAMATVSRAVGIDPNDPDGAPVYADLPSWGATGERNIALFDYLILERVGLRQSFQGVVFDPEWIQAMVAKIAPSTGEKLDPERRRARLTALLEGMELSAVMRIDPNSPRNPNVRLWYLRDAPPAPIFGVVAPDGSPSLSTGQVIADRRATVSAGPGRTTVRVRLEPGEYFALVSGTNRTTTRIQASYGREEDNGSVLDNFPQEHGGGRVWLTLSRPTDVRFFLDTDGPVPGEVRLRIWRVRDNVSDR